MLHPVLSAPVGVVILCAKPEERARITPILEGYFKKTPAMVDGYPTFILDAGTSGVEERLVVADCGEMANVSAASRTGYLAARFTPNLIVFVGTGGTLRPEKCRICDVVVPTLGVTTKYYDKIADGGGTRFKWGVLPEQSADLGAFTRDKKSYKLRRKTRDLRLTPTGRSWVTEAKSKTSKSDRLHFDLKKLKDTDADPEVHIDTSIFSWDMVLASDHYRKLLITQIDSKALAVDMESFGFLSALIEFQAPPVNKAINAIIVRGISDDCGNKDTSFADGRNDIATDNAAHVACRIIKNGYLVL